MSLPVEYAVANTFRIPVIKRASVDFAVGGDWTPAAGDVKISIDGGAAANITTLPTAVAMGNTAYWLFSLSAAELTGRKIIVTVSDAATKAVEDQAFDIYTNYHQSAHDPAGVKRGRSTAGGVAAQTLTMAAEAAPGVDFFAGDVVEILSATTGAGQFSLIANSTNANPPVLTLARAWPVTLTGTVVYRIFGGSGAPATITEINAPVVALLGTPVVSLASDVASLTTAVGTPAGASLAADVAAVQADTDNIQTRIPAALTANGNIKADALRINGIALVGDGVGTPVGAA